MILLDRFSTRLRVSLLLGSVTFSFGCAPKPPLHSPGHLSQQEIPAPATEIPPPVLHVPLLPPPEPVTVPEQYTIVVDNVPIEKLLFALAREAKYNIDIHPDVTGNISLNALNQTLVQILERLSQQLDMVYEVSDNYIKIFPDKPIFRVYSVGYVNMARESTSEVSVATQVAKTGSVNVTEGSGGSLEGNNSTTTIKNQATHDLWGRLTQNIKAILLQNSVTTAANVENHIVINPESGTISVLATRKQHEDISRFLDKVVDSVKRQVLIEATVAEVRLNDQYQAGIDWQRIDGDFTYLQQNIAAALSGAPFYAIQYQNKNSKIGDISASVKMLEQFGSVKVLSSPKLMVLNNQTAILKVVDNLVYFTIKVEVAEASLVSGARRVTYETQVNTVPVGLVMAVTPQIGGDDVVTLNIRPTISRVLGFKKDPNPELAEANVISEIPEIQVREIESILKVNHQDIAVIGGLMQDNMEKQTAGVPVLSKLPWVGDLFSYRNDQYTKTELVIFLRPVVVKTASLNGDLQDFQRYLPNVQSPESYAPTGLLP
ncbi:pilus (MSHA type) biogenesis protein MshL [Thioflexithrix psekupsensis]|uniref:Pilus (MSHA type) biogenesis protein MshL n=1 Tax=Thioflexithrix psekupsensis TaxID=1570016 RepID=A0A251XA99_9GAMM|nr:pilus (MSHA type) biogenesis protein MshL [Thioflexithrix psekupsensis]OUD15238.1 pilus (MSHA type) biogenesis protein MshL [Thioflexithrix psekupsensis]